MKSDAVVPETKQDRTNQKTVNKPKEQAPAQNLMANAFAKALKK
jgi:hypothetical protein